MSTERDAGAELAAHLRTLADWVETRPIVAATMLNQEYRGPNNVFAYPHEHQWDDVLREIGSFTKDADDDYLYAVVNPSPIMTLKIMGRRSDTCERVQVGETIVEREVYPDDVKPEIVTETVPVYEWVCPDSWLGATA